MKLAFIGIGNVGFAIANNLQKKGHNIIAVSYTHLDVYKRQIYNFKNESWNITERLRLGVKKNKTAFGLMMDFNQSGITTFKTTENTGAFVRYEF